MQSVAECNPFDAKESPKPHVLVDTEATTADRIIISPHQSCHLPTTIHAETMATSESITLNAPHAPHPNAIEAFNQILPKIQNEIKKSRHHWDLHEKRMWSRVSGLSDEDLVAFQIEKDLVEVRSAVVSYGTIILGKIRIPGVSDNQGEGFIHVRIHDPPNRGNDDVMFHSIFTDERRDSEGNIVGWCAIQTTDTPLDMFNE